jgi:hypothetical protein
VRHRTSPNFGAQAEGIDSDRLVEMLLEHMESFGTGGGSAGAGAAASVSAKKRKKERA